MSSIDELLTIEEYCALTGDDRLAELVRGKVVTLDFSTFQEGLTCANMGFVLGSWIRPRKLGWILAGHTGIITHRDPDTVRTMDLAFYTFDRMAIDDEEDTYPEVAPELLIQIKPFGLDRPEIEAKVAEFPIIRFVGRLRDRPQDPIRPSLLSRSARADVRPRRRTHLPGMPAGIPGSRR